MNIERTIYNQTYIVDKIQVPIKLDNVLVSQL